VKYPLLNFSAAFAALILAGCATTDKPVEAPKPVAHVTAKFLTYRDIQDFAEKHPALNDRLKTLAPTMAYHEGRAKADVIPLVAGAAGLAAQEILDFLGKTLEAEAKKHSAAFAAYVQQPDWWTDGQPDVAAVELTRTVGEGETAETTFDAIVLIRPVFSTLPPDHPRLAAFQLVPAYLLETKPAAEDFGKTMGAVLSVTLECSWTADTGAPTSEVLATYSETISTYEVGQPVLIAATEAPVPKDSKGPAEIKLSDASHFFAMPERTATIGVKFGVAEADPSQWVGILEKLGEAISGEAGSANTAVKNKLNPPST